MLLASILTGGRVATNLIHAAKGTTPPHLEKARLRAEQKAAAAPRPAKQRSPYAEGKPRVRDVAAAFCGDAMADAIDLHNRRRAEKAEAREKRAAGEPVAKPVPLRKRVADLLINPVGEPKQDDTTDPEAVSDPEPPLPPDSGPVDDSWQCPGCGITLWAEGKPADPRCQGCRPKPAPARRRRLYELGPDNCLACGLPGRVEERLTGRAFTHDATGDRCPDIEPRPEDQPGRATKAKPVRRAARPDSPQALEGDGIDWESERAAIAEAAVHIAHDMGGDCHRPGCDDCFHTHRRGTYRHKTLAEGARAAACPTCGGPCDAAREFAGGDLGRRVQLHCPDCGWSERRPYPTTYTNTQPSSGGDRNTETASTEGAPMSQPTGEAVNYETTVNELEAQIKIHQQHVDSAAAAVGTLEASKAAISDVQVSYTPASQSAASIHEHLSAKGLDPQTIGFTGQVADALPPNRVDVMYDQLDGMLHDAKAQQANAEVALGSAEAALQTIVAKYGDAHNTVQQELGGNAEFLGGNTSGPPGAARQTEGFFAGIDEAMASDAADDRPAAVLTETVHVPSGPRDGHGTR